MTKIVKMHMNDWSEKLNEAQWAYRIKWENTTRFNPYQLVYGKEALFPTHIAFPVMKLLKDSNEEPNDFSRRINQIIELNEDGDEVHYKLNKYQSKMKSLFDRNVRERDFRECDLVLIWNARREDKGKHGKFYNLWLGPFSIVEVKGNNTFILHNLEGAYSSFPVNGKYLKHYIQY